MGIFALVTGIIGGLSTIYGALVAFDVLPDAAVLTQVDWTFWLVLAVVLMLATIALLHARGPMGD